MSETYDLPGTTGGSGPPAPQPPPAPQSPPAGPAPRHDANQPAAPSPPEPLGVVVGMTGNAEVDAAVVRLGDADELPTDGHIEVYEDVHQGLRDALAALDENRG